MSIVAYFHVSLHDGVVKVASYQSLHVVQRVLGILITKAGDNTAMSNIGAMPLRRRRCITANSLGGEIVCYRPKLLGSWQPRPPDVRSQ